MERRMLLAIVLSVLVVMLYSAMTGQCTPPPPKNPKGTKTTTQGAEHPTAPEPPTEGTEEGPEKGENAPPVVPPPPPETGAQKDVVLQPPGHLENEELDVVTTSRGAGIESVRLKHALSYDRKTPFDLVVPFLYDKLLGQVDDSLLEPPEGQAPGGADRRDLPAGPLRTLNWTLDEKAAEATPENDVVYVYRTGAGATYRKRYIVAKGEGRFDVKERLTYQPPPGSDAKGTRLKVLVSAGLLREGSTGARYLYPNTALVRLSNMSEPHKDGRGLPDTAEPNDALLEFLGTRSHYFLLAFYSEGPRPMRPTVIRWWGTGEDASRRKTMEENAKTFFAEKRHMVAAKATPLSERIVKGVASSFYEWMTIEVPAGAEEKVEIPIYMGPIDRHVLAEDEYRAVKPVIAYPFAPDIVADALLGIYDVFRALLGSTGLAVILMTLLVRGLMMPLSIRNQLGMRQYGRKMAKIKPKREALKKKYANNPRRLREEEAKLLREHGIGLPTGCLMMVIQVPVFFALFSCLRAEYTLRNQSFLWIRDLSGPDRLIDFGSTINIGPLSIFSLNLLPLLMIGLSIWQQRLMPKPVDDQQAQQMRMMKWMPVLFAVILYNYTAALALYMVFSSVVAITESRIVRRKDAAAQEAAPA
jgi:YidC/Oxa1 family membrane protein insertase